MQLTAISLARLLMNTGLRMVYPFAPALARGLGVELTAVYQLITLRNFSGFLSPLFGPMSERYGRRVVMVGALLLLGGGCLFIFLWPAYWPLGIALIAISIAKVIYDPAMQAYVGDAVPYAARGKAIAITEISWSAGLLLGGPAVGFAIARWGWSSPFVGLAALAVLAAVGLRRVLPPSPRHTGRVSGFRQMWRIIRQNRVIWAMAAYTSLSMAANENLFIIFGDWMEQSYDLTLTSLGLASGVIGMAEITGELFAGWSVDRFGKRRVIITTGLMNALFYVAISMTAASLTGALVTLFLLFFTFEVTVVGGVPLLTELVPSARSVVMSVNVAAFALGRALGSFIGPEVSLRAGFLGNGVTAAVLMLISVLILAYWVKEAEATEDTENIEKTGEKNEWKQ